MHVQTHILSGWIAGNCLKLDSRRRALCMVAASICDLDGISCLFGQNAYWNFHHLLCHNLLFGCISSGVLAWFSRSRAKSFLIYFSLFHLHLLMDYYGSGPGWDIYYLFPFSRRSVFNIHAWAFYSWQNLTIAAVLLVWTIGIALRNGRTPLESPMPDLDRQLVEWFRKKLPFLVPAGMNPGSAFDQRGSQKVSK